MSTDSGEPDIPREPSAYRVTLHFKQRFEDAQSEFRRHLDGEIIQRCITHGEPLRENRHTVRFEETIAGVTYRIVVNPTNGTCVSGYPTAIDWDIAMDSGRWTRPQLEDIQEFLDAKPEHARR
jgi:hypothetical protein